MSHRGKDNDREHFTISETPKQLDIGHEQYVFGSHSMWQIYINEMP